MPETSEALYARAQAAADTDGRLGVPKYVDWDIFPFEGELLVKRLEPPVIPEPPRHGEGGTPCGACEPGGERAVWANDTWTLTPLDEPNGLPATVMLQPREHLDLGDLTDQLAAELGLLTIATSLAASHGGTALPS